MNNELPKLYDQYMDECKFSRGLRSETMRSYKEVFKHFSRMVPEVTVPSQLSSQIMTEFFKRLQERTRMVGKGIPKKGVRESTIKTYGSKLNSFFEWMRQHGHLIDNPLDKMRLPFPRYEDTKALRRIAVEKIYSSVVLNAPDSFTRRRDTMMVSLLLFCGLRKGEFISLQIRDVDLNKQLITVRAATSKSKKDRQIPLHPTAALHIKEYLEEVKKAHLTTPYLIASSRVSDDKELSRDGLKHWVRRMNISSGVKFHLHQFRHTFACNLAKNNVSAVKIQKLMGHMDIRMTMVYLRSISAEDTRSSVELLSIDGLE